MPTATRAYRTICKVADKRLTARGNYSVEWIAAICYACIADSLESRPRDVRRTSAGVRSRVRNRIQADTENGTCEVPVPALGFAAFRASHLRD